MLLFLQNTDINPAGGIVLAALIGLVIYIVISQSKKIDKELAHARFAYQLSLQRLKSNPTDADLKQRTLQLGRVYSHATRKMKGVTIFDEVALMNDIEAACAGAASIRENRVRITGSIQERLEKLAELKANGFIDDEEYFARKQRILDEV